MENYDASKVIWSIYDALRYMNSGICGGYQKCSMGLGIGSGYHSAKYNRWITYSVHTDCYIMAIIVEHYFNYV